MRQIYSSIIKAFLDKLIALIVLVILFPIIVIITLLLWFKHGEILYLQKRPGFKGVEFTILKFSSLNADEIMDSDLRRFLRKSHFNEIPQLINILKGNMSWVGPRPLLSEYMPYYTQRQNERHNVKPGIFGLAQLQENQIQTWDEKFELDIKYVQRQSFTLDIKILIASIKQALTGKLFDRAGSLDRFKSE